MACARARPPRIRAARFATLACAGRAHAHICAMGPANRTCRGRRPALSSRESAPFAAAPAHARASPLLSMSLFNVSFNVSFKYIFLNTLSNMVEELSGRTPEAL